MITIHGFLNKYQFGSFGDAIKRLNQWQNDGLVSERDIAEFIIQLFHEIPEELYNDIVNQD